MIDGQTAFKMVDQAAWLAGINVTQLCKEAKTDRAKLTRWKNGQCAAREETVQKLLNAAAELRRHNKHLKR